MRRTGGITPTPVTGAVSLSEIRNDKAFQRVLYHGTVLSTEEWDWIAAAGFTLVHSYGGDPFYLRQMMDEAHKRGLKMIAGSWQGQQVPWLRLSLDRNAAGAPASLRFDVRHHYSDAHPSLVFFANPGHPLHLRQIPLENPTWNTLGKLAAYLNSLGGGLSAQVEPGKESMSSEFLATWQYGDLANGTISVYGSELPNTYRQYVNVVKDHPALFCFVPFDDVDLQYFSPTFQRFVRDQIRQWAPGVPAYILPQGAQPGTFQHDHKVAWDAYDGIINYIYPGVLPDHVDVMRTIPQDFWAFHAQEGFKPWLLLGKAFSFSNASGLPPKGSLIEQWEAAKRAGVPLTGFGFYAWQHNDFSIGSIRRLQQEAREVNRLMKDELFDLRIEQNLRRTQAPNVEVTLQAKVYGSKPPFVFQWDFGDGAIGWGENVVHAYSRPGAYQPKVTCLDGRGLAAVKETRVYVTGPLAPTVREDFNDGVADNFTARGGEWRIEQGRYIPSKVTTESASALPTGAGRQYSVEADVAFTDPGGEAWILWSGAATNTDSRLSWRIPSEPEFTLKGTALLELRTDSGIAKAYLAFDRSHTYHVTLDVFADVVTVSVDGKFLLEQPSKAQGGDGVIGVGVKNSRAAFDNLAVASLPGLRAIASITGPEPSSAPYAVNFSAGVVGGKEPFTFAWDFGDGSKSTVRDPQHVYADKGAWRIDLRITDATGQSASSSLIAMTGAQTYYREAEDYDWTDGLAPGYPSEAALGVRYGSGQKGRRGVDYYQLHSDEGQSGGGRDLGGVSLETGKSDTGINIRSAGATDWWNYTFKFPSPGVARIRALWSAEGPPARLCRVYWKGQTVEDLVIPGNGEQNYTMLATLPFPVDASLGQVQFRPLDWGLGFARFEISFVPAVDSDGDGIVNLFDMDSDNDGFMNADESTNSQSDPLLVASRAKDTDFDHLSDANDPDIDNDGIPNLLDPYPLTANRAPILANIGDQTVRASETLTLQVAAMDVDLPAQNVSFKLSGEIPNGARVTADGVLTWTPTPNQALKSYTLTVAASDDGLPPLATSKSFKIQVNEPKPDGFEAVLIVTTNGPVTVVVPRKRYEFKALNRTLFLATTGADSNDGSTNRPWRTFKYALAQLQPGDVLYIRGGDYPEPFVITQPGTKFKPIVITAYPGERPKILQPDGWQNAHPNSATVTFGWLSKFVWLHGLEIEGGWRRGSTYTSDFSRNCITLSGQAEGCRIINNLCSRAFDVGIEAGGDLDVLIEGNVLWECGYPWLGTGISLRRKSDHGSIVRGNVILKCGSGMNLWGYAPGNYFASGNHIYNNVVFDNGPYGIYVLSATNNTIAHNVWARHTSEGIGITKDTSAISFLNNILFDNVPSNLRLESYFPADNWDPRSNIFDYSAIDPRSELASPLDWFTPWIGSHLVRADPLFVDSSHYDFRLQANSPCRDVAGAVKLIGARPFPDMGLFPATYYWQPDLVPVPELEINEGEEFRYQLRLAETNANVTNLKFEFLKNPPVGARLDPATGLFTWKPTELQGPSTNVMTVMISADDSPLLTSWITFEIKVRENNTPPTLAVFPDQVISEGTPLVSKDLVPTSASAFLLADSVAQFSGVQAGNDWTYGYRNFTQDGGQTEYDAKKDFIPFRGGTAMGSWDGINQQWTGAPQFAWELKNTNQGPWTKMAAQFAHPYGGKEEHWAIRRWTATRITNITPAAITWQVKKFSPGGDGVTGGLFLNGKLVDSITIAGEDQANPPRQSYVLLNPNDIVDLALTPQGLNFRDDGSDGSITWFKVETRVPPGVGATDVDWPADTLTFSLGAGTPVGMTVNSITGRLSWTPDEAQGPGTYPIAVRLTDTGNSPLSAERTFTITVSEVNSEPILAPIANQFATEGTPFTLRVTASDPDLPANTLTYALTSAPPGMSVGAATGLISWTPGEDAGGNSFAVTVHVTDNGTPPLSASRTFAVAVTEVNSPPVLAAIPDASIDELRELAFIATAADPDLTANALAFSLDPGAPSGASISAAGAFNWTPTEVQGPGTYPITVRVTDNGAPPLSDTKTFTVKVNEVNSAPVLPTIPDQSATEGTPFTLNITASDADLPANALAFGLVDAPAGTTLDPLTGVLTWTPTEAQGPSTTVITVQVTDNGAPPLSASATFTVTVTEVNSPTALAAISDASIDELRELTFTATATDPDLPANALAFSLDPGAPSGASISAAGAFNWTPTELQGPGTYPITVRVTDNGSPPLSDTKAFTITVNEVNEVPSLGAITDKITGPATQLKFMVTAADLDLPLNVLNYTLEPGTPEGASIDSQTGSFTWTPTEAHARTTNQISVRVVDNGMPPLSATTTFNIIVSALPVVPPSISTISVRPDGGIALAWSATPGTTYVVQRSEDLVRWLDVTTLKATDASVEFTDSRDLAGQSRFYRIVQR